MHTHFLYLAFTTLIKEPRHLAEWYLQKAEQLISANERVIDLILGHMLPPLGAKLLSIFVYKGNSNTVHSKLIVV